MTIKQNIKKYRKRTKSMGARNCMRSNFQDNSRCFKSSQVVYNIVYWLLPIGAFCLSVRKIIQTVLSKNFNEVFGMGEIREKKRGITF